MYTDFVAIRKRYAEFPFDRLFRLAEEVVTKRAVPAGPHEQSLQRIEGVHHLGDLPFDEFLENAVNGHELIEGATLHHRSGLHDVDSIGLFQR